MKKYPKVPRYDHPVIEEEFWDQDDMHLLEKMDGQNYRFFLYDSSMDYYKNKIDNNDDFPSDISKSYINDGDIVFGTKNVVRGSTGMSKNMVEEKFYRAYEELDSVDTNIIKNLQENYGPMIFYCEHMLPHSIKAYYKGDNVVPGLLGFDIYCPNLDKREKISSHPYNEKFEGFLDLDIAREIFNSINIEFVPVLEENITIEDSENYEVPISKYADTKAEGIVFRSDKFNRRVKKTSEYFDEIHKESWGIRKEEAETGEEYIVAKTVTTPRVRKIFNKSINKGIEFDKIPMIVIKDIWEEELDEITSLPEMKINPYKMNQIILNRVENELEKLVETSNLIDSYELNVNENINLDDLDISIQRKTVSKNDVEQYLVDEYIDKEYVYNVAKKHYDRPLKRKDIEKLHRLVTEEFWYDHYDEIIKIDEKIDPSIIKRNIAKKCSKMID